MNSTPLGEVVSERQIRDHRTRAGMRIGDQRHVDLVRYVAWLARTRHAARMAATTPTTTDQTLDNAARSAAELASRRGQIRGHGQKLTSKQEVLIAALLTEPTYAAAAAKAGVSEGTVYRWFYSAEFADAYRQARQRLVDAAIGRIQAATGEAVEALVAVARKGRRDGDRVRAAVALLEHSVRGLEQADLLRPPAGQADTAPMGTADVVRVLATRLRQVETAELSTAERSRLTTTLADALIRAIGVDQIYQRLEALQAVLGQRGKKGKK